MGSLVTLLMSDIVGSTGRWNMAEGAMVADLETHDRLIAQVITAEGGRVFKHTGDGMIAVFVDPVGAVAAATALQRAIGDTSWQHTDRLQVRAAVHSGIVYEREGDMFGTAMNKLARILSLCPPRAVLVSSVVAGLLADRAPEGVSVQQAGEVMLSGFTTPEVVHAVTAAGVAEVDSLGNVPVKRRIGIQPPIEEELVGRTTEIAAIWDALGRARLVTLVGVGGIGKTRLASEVAAGSVDTFTGGVWWIDLATATSPDAVLPVAMAAVGARDIPGRTALESFSDRFAATSAMIVIDNCEHVLFKASELVRAVRSAAPDVRILATSREALGVRGEHIVPIGSLAIDDGIALFFDRATAVRPDLDVDAARAVIERICTRLDAIPLAIELAAARCRIMHPAEIDELLGHRFRLLRGGRAGSERHRTLHATVAWSYEMLSPDEQLVFNHLSMFAGGTLVDGLQAVTGLDRFDLLDLVDRLVARSMVVTSKTALGTRYQQLETLRQFAEDRLLEAGAIEQARSSHLAWMRHLAAQMASSNGTPRNAGAFLRFCAEVDNLRVAVAHAVTKDHHDIAQEIVAAVRIQALARPVLEVFDWVRPIRRTAGWTHNAAICAAFGSSVDQSRGFRPPDGPIAGLPEHLIHDIPAVAAQQARVMLLNGHHWRKVTKLIEQLPASHATAEPAITWTWILAFNFGVLAGDVSAAEIELMQARGREFVDTIRRSGDELLLATALATFAVAQQFLPNALNDVMRLADESIYISDRLGMKSLKQIALLARITAFTRTHAENPDNLAECSAMVRTAIADLLDDQQIYYAGVLTNPACRLIAATEPGVAIVMALVWQRYAVGFVAQRLQLAGIRLPDDIDNYQKQADELSLAAAIQLVLAALDRIIQADSARTAVRKGG